MSKIACILVGVLVLVSFASALQFPEVVGKKGEAAKEIILRKFPQMRVFILKDGSPVTMDYRPDRVRIFVDDDGLVVSTPYTG